MYFMFSQQQLAIVLDAEGIDGEGFKELIEEGTFSVLKGNYFYKKIATNGYRITCFSLS